MAQNNQAFDQLKQKYQPVLNLMKQLQVQLQNCNMEGNRLLIRGAAPSADVKNKIWDQIKLIDSSISDLICDISVPQQQQQPAMTAGASIGGGQNHRHYTVKAGIRSPKSAGSFMATPTSTPRFSTPTAMYWPTRTRSVRVRTC